MRIRFTAVDEFQFLLCLKHGLWGSNSNRFKEWKRGDILVIRVNKHVAGFGEVSGEPYQSEEPVWTNGTYPWRIPIKFLHATKKQNREDRNAEQLAKAFVTELGSKYGSYIQTQTLLTEPQARSLSPLIQLNSNDLVEIGRTLDQLLTEAEGERDQLEKARKPPLKGDDYCWVISAGQGGSRLSEFLSENRIAIGWDLLGDLSVLSEGAIHSGLAQHYPAPNPQPNNLLACFQFAHTMRKGDLVFVRRGRSEIVAMGRIASGYKFDADLKEYCHTRKVVWEAVGNWSLTSNRFGQKTLTQVTDSQWINDLLDLVAENVTAPNKGAPQPFLDARLTQAMLDVLVEKKNIILQGAPGTGKTFLARFLAEQLTGGNPSQLEIVQFHPSYSYEDFVQGYRPSPHGFERKNGLFFRFCERASKSPEKRHVMIIDEVNRGNANKIFGELMMLLENTKRGPSWAVQLAYSNEGETPFFIPENIFVVGTVNTSDRSLSQMDYALRRRFSFFSVQPAFQTKAFRAHLISVGLPTDLASSIIDRMTALNEAVAADTKNLGEGCRIGHSFFCPQQGEATLDEIWYRRVIKLEIQPLLEEYWFDDPEKVRQHLQALLVGIPEEAISDAA